MPGDRAGAERRARLRARRLYLVCGVPGEPPDAGRLPDLLRAAVAGGVDIVQLREKRLADDELAAVAHAARALCERIGALFIVNDRPAVAARGRAPTASTSARTTCPSRQVRELVGPEMLIGLSTHAEAEIDAVGPGARRLHRRGPGARDADQAGPPGGGRRAGPLRRGPRARAVLRDRRARRRQHRRGASQAGAGRVCRAARDRRRRGPARRRRASCASSSARARTAR